MLSETPNKPSHRTGAECCGSRLAGPSSQSLRTLHFVAPEFIALVYNGLDPLYDN